VSERRGYAYSVERLWREQRCLVEHTGLSGQDIMDVLDRYRLLGLAGLHEDGSGYWWLAREPKDELWWPYVAAEPSADDDHRVRRSFRVRPCPDCGEQTSAASGYFCAACHFAGWWWPQTAQADGDDAGEVGP
jgi:hypothetical protein